MKKAYIYSGIGIYVLCSTPALADHPTGVFGSEAMGAINTISAILLPVGAYGLGVRSEMISNDEFSSAQLESFAANDLEGVHSIKKIISTSVSLSYGVSENLSISARIPYIKRDNIREGELDGGVPEAHSHGNSSGTGDLALLGQYGLEKHGDFYSAILFGVKAPTGETDVLDVGGIRFETELQPGTGSWDYFLGTSVTMIDNNYGCHANVLFNRTTEGSQFTKIGNVVSYNAALTYRLNDSHASHDHSHASMPDVSELQWDFSLELNGETRDKNKISGVAEDNAGGTTIYLTPGIRMSSKDFSGFISYGVAVVDDQNGTQTDVDGRIVAGVSLVL